MRHLSLSNVLAVAAIFIALGAGAYAATQLPKGSVGSKQLKKRAVKTKNLAKKAVGSKQLKSGAVATKQLAGNAVNGSKVADNSLTGDDIDESTLKGVANADRVGGSQVIQISYDAGPNTPARTLFSIGGLTVSASCPSAASDFVNLIAETDTNDSIISLPNQVNPAGTVGTQNDFDAGAPLTVPIDDTTATMSYGRGPSNTPVVTANFLANQFSAGGTNGQCEVVGTVVTNG